MFREDTLMPRIPELISDRTAIWPQDTDSEAWICTTTGTAFTLTIHYTTVMKSFNKMEHRSYFAETMTGCLHWKDSFKINILLNFNYDY